MTNALDLTELIKMLEKVEEIELENIDMIAGEVGFILPTISAIKRASVKKAEYLDLDFEIPLANFPSEVLEVELGATKANGGTRENVIKVGGERTMPFYNFEALNPNEPVIAFDVFDTKIHLAGPVRKHFEDVLEDPAEWAKRCVDKYGADMVTIHLISTDPAIKDTSAREAAKTVEDVLQAVKVPIMIGGSGNPDKDPEVLEKAAEAAAGERCVINSASMSLDYKRIAKACLDYGHVVLSWTSLDINDQKTLNKYLIDLGIKREDIIMDPTTAALGYGLEYSFSIMERIRLAALKGDKDLQMPIASGTTNAWGAREAWMENPEWGDREKRGPLWEAVTALTLCLAGSDLFMMMNPTAMQLFRDVIKCLCGFKETGSLDIKDWIGMR
ncbi:MAG: CO dehydrogenase/acetyl-CoA synthase subunit delta [Methanocellales archaeon]|nr:CO dehydrogenase/acetyl-CoA synthase subunit delta [Methanocellales archaeon]MDD3420775.1 CO dehydrogenase/acetyl-CoA synthase subunit delta [Methanocellales archaeon]MDD4898443.1 CO dehydrogenase/acetyl-CoA synthase subunit delta [Methanocellales archaeon]MDD5446271.1 CO dehydrogenase/acetyl-CoA synthase subunit delta [Methanocellales archaeon]